MLYFIGGASGSGKTACIEALQRLLPNAIIHDFDNIGVPDNADSHWRQQATEKWLQKVIDEISSDQPYIICGQVVLGEILASPSGAQLLPIHSCLLDVTDIERVKRLNYCGTYGANQDTLNWAAWLRMHHVDPQWEQHVIKNHAWENLEFSRWDNLLSWGDLAVTHVIDTTSLSIAEVAQSLFEWITKYDPTDNNNVILLEKLERQLLTTSTRHSQEYLRVLLADDFFEIGKSGAVYDKQATIDALLNEGERNIVANDFAVQSLDDNVFLVTYSTIENHACCLRTSIWQKLNGEWKMRFHQATPC